MSLASRLELCCTLSMIFCTHKLRKKKIKINKTMIMIMKIIIIHPYDLLRVIIVDSLSSRCCVCVRRKNGSKRERGKGSAEDGSRENLSRGSFSLFLFISLLFLTRQRERYSGRALANTSF